MIPLEKKRSISKQDVSRLIKEQYIPLIQAFYESQGSFMSSIYKQYGNLDSANIVLCFAKALHLEIIRQREKDLNFNVSLNNLSQNIDLINLPSEKITSVVKITGMAKETVRRKIKNLKDRGLLFENKIDKGFYWNLPLKEKEMYFKIIKNDTKNLSRFVTKFTKFLNIKIKPETVEDEIISQFSFYWYHYLSCQLEWLKWWQMKLKDNDLILIALQATIPTLKYYEKKEINNVEDIFQVIGKYKKSMKSVNCSVSPTSLSEITGIPRATCIRKLDKLVKLGFLVKLAKTKRYEVNQSTEPRTKIILSKENVNFTITTFSEYISIILNSLIHNKL